MLAARSDARKPAKAFLLTPRAVQHRRRMDYRQSSEISLFAVIFVVIIVIAFITPGDGDVPAIVH